MTQDEKGFLNTLRFQCVRFCLAEVHRAKPAELSKLQTQRRFAFPKTQTSITKEKDLIEEILYSHFYDFALFISISKISLL